MRCAVYGCDVDNQAKNFSPDVKFFSFPKDPETQDKWKHLCKRSDKLNVKNARICSKHFSANDYERNLKHELLGYAPKKHRPLRKEAIPSKNLPDNLNYKEEKRESCKKKEGKELVETSVEAPLRRVNPSAPTEIEDKNKLIASLQEKIQILEQRQDIIKNLFSPAQLQKLEGSKACLKWSIEDISKSIVIYSAGPRAYRLLLKKGYPFPAISTLRSWLKKKSVLAY